MLRTSAVSSPSVENTEKQNREHSHTFSDVDVDVDNHNDDHDQQTEQRNTLVQCHSTTHQPTITEKTKIDTRRFYDGSEIPVHSSTITNLLL